jgi:hypothetical protein
VISQCFSIPAIIIDREIYLGGTTSKLQKGRITDFLYKNQLSNNTVIIEIKKPSTPVLGAKYRGSKEIYTLSSDLTGAINQILDYRDVSQKEYINNIYKSEFKYDLFNPKLLLIVGSLEKLNKEQKKCFEIFRGELKSLELITFDELFKKIELLAELYQV